MIMLLLKHYFTNNMKHSLISLLFFSLLSLQACSLVEKDESEWTVKDFYSHAKDAFESEQWESAIGYYEKLKAYYPYGKYAEQSYLELAYAYYRYDEPESAQRELEEFIRLYPKHAELAYAYYLRALASDSINKSWLDSWLTDPAKRDMASTTNAYQAYIDLLNRFPNSKYAAKSRERLIVLRNRLARHEYQVAQYYFNRQAYLAAANRAKQIIQSYPRSMVNIKALALMQEAYTKLGMTQNADNVQSVIDLNNQQIKEQKAKKSDADKE
ncbi:outer membrane protein assembly factor BamD [Hydrogenovibrio sp. 3SP14C1]|uniref:outer membrane protein assembly factor BamD n=1 Tax=Hydrogenovibrio sp. 3SP14C1 TaxID=3038774 RepID=UPI002416E796|nr:outer membrane protein assembly factor BamD [Hydrogenovibrio sp. 3SP14C1]MDG4813007.1 outer membrane protein assembly factor BamD [Hydrogenovibrio sp. 3SP14C1]